MVGGMGHSSMVSLGYSLKSKKKVICLDGDGSLLMHMGSLRTIGHFGNTNFKHILLNNNSHESVGGQITNAYKINFNNLTKSLGYKNFFRISKVKEIKFEIKKFLKCKGPSFLEVKISEGTINNLSRPKDLIKIKKQFMS
jgi:phosphonopyruvate decarboxylase